MAQSSCQAFIVSWNGSIICRTEAGELRQRPIGTIALGENGNEDRPKNEVVVWDFEQGKLLVRSAEFQTFPYSIVSFLEGTCAFQGYDGRYLCARPDGAIVCDAMRPQLWETYALLRINDCAERDLIGLLTEIISIVNFHRLAQTARALRALADLMGKVETDTSPWLRLALIRAEILLSCGLWENLAEIVGPKWDFYGSARLKSLVTQRASTEKLLAATTPVRAPCPIPDSGPQKQNAPHQVRKRENAASKRRRIFLRRLDYPNETGIFLRRARVIGHDFVSYMGGFNGGALLISEDHHRWFFKNGPEQDPALHPCDAAYPRYDLDGFSILLGGHMNYYHNLINYMLNYFYIVKMKTMQQIFNNPTVSDLEEARIIIRTPEHSFHRDMIEYFGLESEKCFHLSDQSCVRCEKLFLPPRAIAGHGVVRDMNAVRWLQSKFTIYPAKSYSPFIYISRDRARMRRVINEDEVRKAVDRFGFEVVVLENMSVSEQFEVFRHAKIVIGPHGAGFTNLVATLGRCTLVEIFPENVPRPHYFSNLADGLGHHYTSMVATSEPETHNMKIDVSQLLRLIEGLGVVRRTDDAYLSTG